MAAVTQCEPEGRLAELVRRVRSSRERVHLAAEDGGEVVMISREELDELEALEDAADREAFDRAKAADDGTRIPWEDVKAELGL